MAGKVNFGARKLLGCTKMKAFRIYYLNLNQLGIGSSSRIKKLVRVKWLVGNLSLRKTRQFMYKVPMFCQLPSIQTI